MLLSRLRILRKPDNNQKATGALSLAHGPMSLEPHTHTYQADLVAC